MDHLYIQVNFDEVVQLIVTCIFSLLGNNEYNDFTVIVILLVAPVMQVYMKKIS